MRFKLADFPVLSSAQKAIPRVGAETISAEALAKGNFVEVVTADYQEV